MSPDTPPRYAPQVHGVIELRPRTQDRRAEKTIDPRRNPWTGQIAPVYPEGDDREDQ